MINMSHEEAMLFRVLTAFFGADHVIYNMSVMTVCGGQLPDKMLQIDFNLENHHDSFNLESWAKKNKCLFTIVDRLDKPCLVIEFFSGFANSVQVVDVEHQKFLKPILSAQGINYITINQKEFAEILDPSSSFDFFSFLKSKVEPSLLVV
jgi:hypothetical protein